MLVISIVIVRVSCNVGFALRGLGLLGNGLIISQNVDRKWGWGRGAVW